MKKFRDSTTWQNAARESYRSKHPPMREVIKTLRAQLDNLNAKYMQLHNKLYSVDKDVFYQCFCLDCGYPALVDSVCCSPCREKRIAEGRKPI